MRCDRCTDHPCSTGNPCVPSDPEKAYLDREERRILQAAGEVESRFYGDLCRFDEVVEFARVLGVHHLGIAFCVGLFQEAVWAAEILEKEFRLTTVCCKTGGLLKEDLEVPSSQKVGAVSCNPVEQARILEEAGTELNLMMGLCVGHDALFLRHSKAWTVPLVVKDRRLGHNPVAALPCPYIRRKLGREESRP